MKGMKGRLSMEVWVVTTYDKTMYRLTKVFSNEAAAAKCKETLKELLWQRITIDKREILDHFE